MRQHRLLGLWIRLRLSGWIIRRFDGYGLPFDAELMRNQHITVTRAKRRPPIHQSRLRRAHLRTGDRLLEQRMVDFSVWALSSSTPFMPGTAPSSTASYAVNVTYALPRAHRPQRRRIAERLIDPHNVRLHLRGQRRLAWPCHIPYAHALPRVIVCAGRRHHPVIAVEAPNEHVPSGDSATMCTGSP